jgi:hypothetical protein
MKRMIILFLLSLSLNVFSELHLEPYEFEYISNAELPNYLAMPTIEFKNWLRDEMKKFTDFNMSTIIGLTQNVHPTYFEFSENLALVKVAILGSRNELCLVVLKQGTSQHLLLMSSASFDLIQLNYEQFFKLNKQAEVVQQRIPNFVSGQEIYFNQRLITTSQSSNSVQYKKGQLVFLDGMKHFTSLNSELNESWFNVSPWNYPSSESSLFVSPKAAALATIESGGKFYLVPFNSMAFSMNNYEIDLYYSLKLPELPSIKLVAINPINRVIVFEADKHFASENHLQYLESFYNFPTLGMFASEFNDTINKSLDVTDRCQINLKKFLSKILFLKKQAIPSEIEKLKFNREIRSRVPAFPREYKKLRNGGGYIIFS